MTARQRAPGAGRKPRDPGGDRAERRITVRLTDAGYAQVEAAAAEAGITVAEYAAGVVLRRAFEDGS